MLIAQCYVITNYLLSLSQELQGSKESLPWITSPLFHWILYHSLKHNLSFFFQDISVLH